MFDCQLVSAMSKSHNIRCKELYVFYSTQTLVKDKKKFITTRLIQSKSICQTSKLFNHSRKSTKLKYNINLTRLSLIIILSLFILQSNFKYAFASSEDTNVPLASSPLLSETTTTTAATCFGGIQTFEKIAMSSFENPGGLPQAGNSDPNSNSQANSFFGSGVLVQQDDQALTSECVNLCRSQSNCLSFVIDYNKFECKSYATTQQELQQEFESKFKSNRSANNSTSLDNLNLNATGETLTGSYQTSSTTTQSQQLLPSASSNYFEKICLDGVVNRNQLNEVCGNGRLWSIERVVDSSLEGFVEKEISNIHNKDECSKLCLFETQFVCRSANFDQHDRVCRLSKEDRRTQPQAMRYTPNSSKHYLENQCASLGPSSCVYETKKNVGIISMDALKFAQTVQDCQLKCNQESTFNCRSYSFFQQRCFLSGDDSTSLDVSIIKLPTKNGWHYGEKKCLVEVCTKGIFSYEKISGFQLRSALTTSIDLMSNSASSINTQMNFGSTNDIERLQAEQSQNRFRSLLPTIKTANTSNIAALMMLMMTKNDGVDPLTESASTSRNQRVSSNNLAITNHCRQSCDNGHLSCPAFAIDYKNNRCEKLDRNSQGRHHELVPRDGYTYFEKICLRVSEMLSMCQDKYWIFERVIGYELAPRLYNKTLKFVSSRRDCQEFCLEEKQFQCRSALYNDETSDCKLSSYDRRLATQESAYIKNFNPRISYLENQCIRDRDPEHTCVYEKAKDEPSYPTFTDLIEMVPSTIPSSNSPSSIEMEFNDRNANASRHGLAYCEQLCNDNVRFECHSFGYYASTAQCFISGDDTISAGQSATSLSSGFTYYEKKCSVQPPDQRYNYGSLHPEGGTTTPSSSKVPTNENLGNPYFEQNRATTSSKPEFTTNTHELSNQTNPDLYKCGMEQSFVFQRVSGFEPIGGYLTLLVKDNSHPGIVEECSQLCKSSAECRAFIVDYENNQCFAMLENSSVGLLSLRQTIGKDYFEGFCVPKQNLMLGSYCNEKSWIVDKILDQAVVGVEAQKVIPDSDRNSCRQACIEERFFWCKSAMFDSTSHDCSLYSIDRETIQQMRLQFTRGVDFFENQCQISSSMCPYDAIEKEITIVTSTKSIQARSMFECERACNEEIQFNCRSYTYLDQYPSLPNMCILSSDSRSTSQKGSLRERSRSLYAERNCFQRRARLPNADISSLNYKTPDYKEDEYSTVHKTQSRNIVIPATSIVPGYDDVSAINYHTPYGNPGMNGDISGIVGQGCEPHQYTFERTFGYDFRNASKERISIMPSIGVAIGCQQECMRQGDMCQSFTVEYSIPFQVCYLMTTQAGSNRKALVKSPNTVYFEKVCIEKSTSSRLVSSSYRMTQDLSQDLNGHATDIEPSYSQDAWSIKPANQMPYYSSASNDRLNNPVLYSRPCAKLWSFERYINFNFTGPVDRSIENVISRSRCESLCINEVSFRCQSLTYDYDSNLCRLFKHTRRTIMSRFIDLEQDVSSTLAPNQTISLTNSNQGTIQILPSDTESSKHIDLQNSGTHNDQYITLASSRTNSGRQIKTRSTSTSHSSSKANIDYVEYTCVPEPSSCQYRQVHHSFSQFIDKISHATSLTDCQRQCDSERLFSCRSINYDVNSRNCMLINEDLISLGRGQQSPLMPKKNTIFSEKGNCEMISVHCNSQEMLVSINFDSPFRGRVLAKGNPENCFMIGDGQTSIQFQILFGPKCNSRQEGHNTFVNEIVIQQHPVIMTDNDKTVRVMCSFEAPEQTITLQSPVMKDNRTGIDVSAPEPGRTRQNENPFNSVVSNKASPPMVLLRILDHTGKDATLINLGDELTLKIHMQTNGQNSALGIFARNLLARSSNGESLLLIDNDGCPVDHQVFPALEIDPKDRKSLQSTFKAFRFPSSGLVNFEVQIKFCPEKCEQVDCSKQGIKIKSLGRRKRELSSNVESKINLEGRANSGRSFQFIKELMLSGDATPLPQDDASGLNNHDSRIDSNTISVRNQPIDQSNVQIDKPIVLDVNEKVVPATMNHQSKVLTPQSINVAPYSRIPGNLEHSFDPPFLLSNNPKEEKRDSISNVDQDTERPVGSNIEQPSFVTKESTNLHDMSSEKEKTSPNENLPLKFSILVGSNTNKWSQKDTEKPTRGNLESDDVVIPGKSQQISTYSNADDFSDRKHVHNSLESVALQESLQESISSPVTTRSSYGKLPNNELHAFNTQPTSSTPEDSFSVNDTSHSNRYTEYRKPINSSLMKSSVKDCGVESSYHWVFIYTGSIVVALNICFITIALFVYSKKARNHSIAESLNGQETGGTQWSSMFKFGANQPRHLGTSLNKHSLFFRDLSKSTNVNANLDLNWPNLSPSSMHSTISSIAEPMQIGPHIMNQKSNSYHDSFPDSESPLRSSHNMGVSRKSFTDKYTSR